MRRIMSRQFWIELRKKHEASTKWKTFMVKLQFAALVHVVSSNVEVMMYLELETKVARTIWKQDTCLIWRMKWRTYKVKLQLATLEHAVLSKVEVMVYLELKVKVAKPILKQDTCLIWKRAMKYVLLRHRASHSRNCIYLTVLINTRMSEQSLNEPLSYLSKLLASNECNADWSSK